MMRDGWQPPRWAVASAIAIWVLGAGAARAQPATVTGTFVTIWADPPPGRGPPTALHMLADGRGRLTGLDVPDRLILEAGGLGRIQGGRAVVTGRRRVTAGGGGARERIDASDVRLESGTVTANAVSGSRRYVILLCRYSDVPAPLPSSAYVHAFTGTSLGGVDGYYREVSNGAMDLAGSVVAGWFTLPFPKSYYQPGGFAAAPDFNKLTEDCTRAADADVDFRQFRGIVLHLSSDVAGGGSAYASSSIPVAIDGRTALYGVLWLGPPVPNGGVHTPSVIAHEYGHSFGLLHSAPIGSMWDVMSNPIRFGQHTIAYHKDLLGWLPRGRVYAPPAAASRQTITLARGALPPAGTTFLMARISIPSAPGQFYTVEARQRIGLDSIVPSDGVLINRVNPTNGEQAMVVDADANGNPNDAGAVWTPGESFTDAAAGISVSIDAATSDGYQITITTGATPATRTLTVTVLGSGEVTSYLGGAIHCSGSCTSQYADGGGAQLLVNPGPGYAFAGWGGDCASWDSSNICAFLMTADRTVVATFVPGHRSTLSLTGLGAVYAYTQPHPAPGAMFGCDTRFPTTGTARCTDAPGWMPRDSVIDFFQYPAPGWAYGPWGGDCTGAAVRAENWCRLVSDGSKAVSVAFRGGATLGLSPLARRDSVGLGATTPQNDSATVTISGAAGSWAATSNRSWLQLTSGSGTGSGVLRWARNPAGLALGIHIGLLTISVPGASGSPAVLVDTLVVLPALLLSLSRTHTGDSAVLGATAPSLASSAVALTGIGGSTKAWSATHGGGAWLSLTSASGQWYGAVQWSRDPRGLAIGTYVDTIVVTAAGALASPATIIDSLRILQPLTAVLGAPGPGGALPQGSTTPVSRAVALTVTGVSNGASTWSAAHGGSAWLTLGTATGAGSGAVAWTVNPAGLGAGVFVETITVTVPGAAGSPLRLVDTLRVYEPAVAVGCAESALLSGAACLGSIERTYLDVTGNRDGRFNLGDLLAYLDRKGLPLGPALLGALAGTRASPSPGRDTSSTRRRP